MFLSDDFMDFFYTKYKYCDLKIQFVDTLHCCAYQLIVVSSNKIVIRLVPYQLIVVSGNKIVIRLIQFSWSYFVQNLAFYSDIFH